jgi:vitamin B12 transporter
MSAVSKINAPVGAVLFCLAAPGLALAQSAPPPDTPVSEFVVTATRIPTKLDQVASSISLITDQDIQDNQWRTLPDVLQDQPGLNVVQTGGPGGQTSVFIRGANSNHTKVIIDGIDANDPSSGLFDFGRLTTADLARVEVLRGAASSLYGSDALGGVVNIVTREGAGPPRLDASIEGGSFDTLNETGSVRGSQGPFSYAANISHFYAGATPITPLGLLTPGERRNDDSYDNLTASGKFGYVLAKDASLHFVIRYTDDDLKFTGDNFDNYPSTPDASRSDQTSRQLFTRAEGRFGLANGAFENVIGFGYTDYSTTTVSPDQPGSSLAAGNRTKFDYQGTLTLDPRAILVFGAEDNQDRLLASPIDAADGYKAGYLELQARPATGLSLAASVRYDVDDLAGGKTTYRIAPTYVIAATGTQLKGSYGTGFKAPTLTQLFVSFPSFDFFANPDLKPETSEGYDVGFEQPLAHGNLRLGATWFHTVITNLIDTNAEFTSYANIGRATTYGVESFVSARFSRRLSARVDYTYTHARDDIADTDLLRRPRTKLSASTTWRATDRLSITASTLYVGAWMDVARDSLLSQVKASPYSVVNIAGSYDVGHGVTLFARVDNLLDRHYQNPSGFDKPGIGAYGGVRVSLR